MWKILCSDFFQEFIPQEAVVLEIGAGYCEFINNIQARKKIAVDLNEDTRLYANDEVKVHICSSKDLSKINSNSVDVVFISNFLEHLSREEIILTLQQVTYILRQGGKLLILQPNYRFCYKDYWMFFDHITPIDDRSLVEILEINGYQVDFVIPRFLPYTTKSALPKSITLVKIYLKFPFIWQFLGSQCFVSVNKQ
jgi:SAM-dependent methyltransferase